MRRLATTLALATALAGGCTTTRYVQRPRAVEEIQPLYTKARFHMTLVHERPVGATSPVPVSLLLARDPIAIEQSVSLVDLANLHGYKIKRRGLGALEGLGMGILIGAVGGALLGAAMGDDSPCAVDSPCIRFTSSDLAPVFGVAGAISGSVVGALTGALVGHTDEYVFGMPPAAPVRGVPPMPPTEP
jgi:hypothetical protein